MSSFYCFIDGARKVRLQHRHHEGCSTPRNKHHAEDNSLHTQMYPSIPSTTVLYSLQGRSHTSTSAKYCDTVGSTAGADEAHEAAPTVQRSGTDRIS